jgi:hypothetical protein
MAWFTGSAIQNYSKLFKTIQNYSKLFKTIQTSEGVVDAG